MRQLLRHRRSKLYFPVKIHQNLNVIILKRSDDTIAEKKEISTRLNKIANTLGRNGFHSNRSSLKYPDPI